MEPDTPAPPVELTPQTKGFLAALSQSPKAEEVPIQVRRQGLEIVARRVGGPCISLRRIEDLTIPSPDGHHVPVRVYLPTVDLPKSDAERLPVVLFVHGGGWSIGSLSTHEQLCRNLASDSHAAVVAVDYRLGPEHPYPKGLDDVETAFRWMTQGTLTEEYKHLINPQRSAIMGDSAGGNLCAALVLRLHRMGWPQDLRPKFQVLLYPTVDLATQCDTMKTFAEGYFLATSDILKNRNYYLGFTAEDDQSERSQTLRTEPEVSPLYASDFSVFPPTLVISADADPLYGDAARFVPKLEEAGVAVKHSVYRGVIHAFVNFVDVNPEARQAAVEAADAIKEALRGACGCAEKDREAAPEAVDTEREAVPEEGVATEA